ncbi:MAG TPA: hypothetical protein VJY31_05800 [Buttiauxella sp.]|nr:hypothetical protein [Buttiauxella sp.]
MHIAQIPGLVSCSGVCPSTTSFLCGGWPHLCLPTVDVLVA